MNKCCPNSSSIEKCLASCDNWIFTISTKSSTRTRLATPTLTSSVDERTSSAESRGNLRRRLRKGSTGLPLPCFQITTMATLSSLWMRRSSPMSTKSKSWLRKTRSYTTWCMSCGKRWRRWEKGNSSRRRSYLKSWRYVSYPCRTRCHIGMMTIMAPRTCKRIREDCLTRTFPTFRHFSKPSTTKIGVLLFHRKNDNQFPPSN